MTRSTQGFCQGDCAAVTTSVPIAINPRSAIKGAVGVLYPDMTKMTTFEARY